MHRSDSQHVIPVRNDACSLHHYSHGNIGSVQDSLPVTLTLQ
jgi:hypothetical protein